MKLIPTFLRLAVVALTGVAGTNLHAQLPAPRPIVMVTAPFAFKGQQTAAGLVADTTYFATFSGQAENTLNNRTRDTVSFTVQYTVANGVGTVSGGQWNLTELIKDRPPFTTGGPITPGSVLAITATNGLAPGNILLAFAVGDPSWPVSASFSGVVDNSRPPRINATMLLTYPVVQ